MDDYTDSVPQAVGRHGNGAQPFTGFTAGT